MMEPCVLSVENFDENKCRQINNTSISDENQNSSDNVDQKKKSLYFDNKVSNQVPSEFKIILGNENFLPHSSEEKQRKSNAFEKLVSFIGESKRRNFLACVLNEVLPNENISLDVNSKSKATNIDSTLPRSGIFNYDSLWRGDNSVKANDGVNGLHSEYESLGNSLYHREMKQIGASSRAPEIYTYEPESFMDNHHYKYNNFPYKYNVDYNQLNSINMLKFKNSHLPVWRSPPINYSGNRIFSSDYFSQNSHNRSNHYYDSKAESTLQEIPLSFSNAFSPDGKYINDHGYYPRMENQNNIESRNYRSPCKIQQQYTMDGSGSWQSNYRISTESRPVRVRKKKFFYCC